MTSLEDLEDNNYNPAEALLPSCTPKESKNEEKISKNGSKAQFLLGIWVLIVSLVSLHSMLCNDSNEFLLGLEEESLDFVVAVKQQDLDANVNLDNPIPPIHPHHGGVVTYSSHMSSDGSVEYRRDIKAPCDHGMLVFSVGLAKDSMPYTYEIYNDAYLYSSNNGLCILNPWFTGYQVSKNPFWNPTDPMRIDIKPLNLNVMHWISSRVVDPYHSKKKYDRKLTGDYVVMAKHDFYNAHYYQELKATINGWK